MAAHRYWRMQMEGVTAFVGTWGFAETAWRSVAGGANLATVLASASASSVYGGNSYPAANAIDGNTATSWVCGQSVDGDWWGYDFGAPVTIIEVSLTGDGYHGCPGAGNIQASDDNATWTTAWTFTAAIPNASWTTGTQTFDAPLTVSSAGFLFAG